MMGSTNYSKEMSPPDVPSKVFGRFLCPCIIFVTLRKLSFVLTCWLENVLKILNATGLLFCHHGTEGRREDSNKNGLHIFDCPLPSQTQIVQPSLSTQVSTKIVCLIFLFKITLLTLILKLKHQHNPFLEANRSFHSTVKQPHPVTQERRSTT